MRPHRRADAAAARPPHLTRNSSAAKNKSSPYRSAPQETPPRIVMSVPERPQLAPIWPPLPRTESPTLHRPRPAALNGAMLPDRSGAAMAAVVRRRSTPCARSRPRPCGRWAARLCRWKYFTAWRRTWTRPCSSKGRASAPASTIRCGGRRASAPTGRPDALRRQVERLFTGPGGPGLPRQARPDDRLAGAAGAAHRLRPRRPHLRLGLQGAGRAHAGVVCSSIIGTSHYQPPPLHADAQGLQDAARRRSDRSGPTSTGW